ncbi:MAG TPA: DUF357 domain-containing protein [Methanocorpusculum sp.]|nr:DUF357 domain-containing protein [Methanocorpusculum sp.]
MLIESYGKEFTTNASTAVPTVSAETPLGATAAGVLKMARCYAFDGMVFHRHGDPVNAVASFAYGHGWLDAGVFLGYLQGQEARQLPEITECVPDACMNHLTEKTHRYQRMLSSALAGVVILPDAETQMWSAAQYINTSAVSALTQGTEVAAAGDLVEALLFISYGYGWLDCGVRSGLFGIVGDRDLFTI